MIFLACNVRLYAQSDSTLNIEWLEPVSRSVAAYEKAEWGIQLPAVLQNAIFTWVRNQNASAVTAPSINPFDDEQLDLTAEIISPQGVQTIFGFFYIPYQRFTAARDKETWTWKEMPGNLPFRFRYTPVVAGNYKIVVRCNAPGLGKWISKSFSFSVTPGDMSKGFISVSKNKHLLQTPDGKIFFPVGSNLMFYGCDCKSELNTAANRNKADGKCASCYYAGNNDFCCSLKDEWRHSFWSGVKPNLREDCEHPAGYIKNLSFLDSIKKAGANTVRVFMNPISFEFEFEKLNNYYDRQYQAWELDQLIEHAHKLGLRLEFNMQFHITSLHGWSEHWDWTDLKNDPQNTTPTMASCYYSERERTNCDKEPISFFREENARKFYKKKLRYFIARYGYSPDLINLELWSEINNVGMRDNLSPHFLSQLPRSLAYDSSAVSRAIIGDWLIEMARFIKEDLRHRNHLIAAEYTGLKNTDLVCKESSVDRSWESPYIDLICFSSYDIGADRWQKWSDHNDKNKCGWYKLGCNNQWRTKGYAAVDKPFFPAEYGSGLLNDEDSTFLMKDMWASAFSGFATAGLNWGRQRPNTWWKQYKVTESFYREKIWSDASFAQAILERPFYGQFADEKAEMILLKKKVINNDNDTKAWGIIMNRTWNPATVEQGIPKDKEGMQFIQNNYPKKLLSFSEISLSGNAQLIFKNFGSMDRYTITWYHPFTGQAISTSVVKTRFGKKLKPIDGPVLNKNLPFVIFEIKRIGHRNKDL